MNKVHRIFESSGILINRTPPNTLRIRLPLLLEEGDVGIIRKYIKSIQIKEDLSS